MIYKDRVSDYPAWGCFAAIILAVLIPVLVTVGLRALRYVVVDRLGLEGSEVGLLGASLLIFGLFLFPLATLTLPALGLLWAPFAALFCARVARSRGLVTRRYALADAIYSILFLGHGSI